MTSCSTFSTKCSHLLAGRSATSSRANGPTPVLAETSLVSRQIIITTTLSPHQALESLCLHRSEMRRWCPLLLLLRLHPTIDYARAQRGVSRPSTTSSLPLLVLVNRAPLRMASVHQRGTKGQGRPFALQAQPTQTGGGELERRAAYKT